MEYCPPLLLRVVAIEKGAFESPSIKVTKFTFLLIYLHLTPMFLNISE